MLQYLEDSSFVNLSIPPEDRNYDAVVISNPIGIYIYRDASGNYHLALRIKSEESIKDPKINGVDILTGNFNLDSESIEKFIDIKLNHNRYEQQFIYLCDEIIKNILNLKLGIVESVKTAVGRNRVFWEKQKHDILSDDNQVGLLCELDFLSRVIDINRKNMLQSWKGPSGFKYDFVYTDNMFEIKGTRGKGHAHTINGLDQLDHDGNKTLSLVSYMVVEKDGLNAMSVSDLANRIMNMLNEDDELINYFNNLLFDYGYNVFHYRDYKKYEIIESKVYKVNDDFPKLTREMINDNLSERVSKISYKIDLNGLESINLDDLSIGDYCY